MIPLYINSLLLLIFLIYLFYTKRSWIPKILVSIWLISFICACIYAQFGLFGKVEISYESFIYLDICILIYLYPLIVNKIDMHCDIPEHTIRLCERLLFWLGILFTLPFIEHVIHFITTFSAPSDSIVDVYVDKMDIDNKKEIVTWLDPFSLQIMKSFGRFNRISLLLLFLIFSKRKKIQYKKYFFYIVAVFTPVLGDINASGRGSFAFFILSVIILYFFFNNNLTIKIPKTLLIAVSLIIGISIIGILAITTMRADAYEADAWIWTSLYFGEGPVRFGDQMWNIKCSTLGDNSFSYFTSLLGFDAVTNVLQRREVWNEVITGVDPVRFYTFIGDWFSDLGIYCTLPFIALLSYYINKYLKRKKYGLIGVFLVYIYIYIFATGYTYYCFKAAYGQYTVVFSVIVLYIITKIKVANHRKTNTYQS